FDGADDYINITANNTLNVQTGNFTVSAWFNQPNSKSGILINKDNCGNAGGWYLSVDWDGTVNFRIIGSTDVYVTGTSTTANAWHHAVFVKEGTAMRLYVDGILRDSDTAPSGIIATNYELILGNRRGSIFDPDGCGDSWYKGSLDEVKIYNSSLSYSQIYQEFLVGNSSRNPNILVFNETAAYDQWYCSVTPNDGTQDGTTANSSAVTIYPFNLVNISAIDCEINSTSWLPCTSALWNDTISQVRVNCTSTNSIRYVTYNISNTPDSSTKFNSSNATSNTSNSWTYNNPDLKISDSGEFKLTVSCYDGNYLQVNTTSWTVPWGYLNASWVSPATDINLSQNKTRAFTSVVECIQGECGDVAVTIDPIMSLTQGSNNYSIESNATYAIVMTSSSNWFGEYWFDLERDPTKATKLTATCGADCYFFNHWVPPSASALTTGHSIEIIENSTTRIKIKTNHYQTSSRNETAYITFYPSGQIFFYNNITSLGATITDSEYPFLNLISSFTGNYTVDNSLDYILRKQTGIENSSTYALISNKALSGSINGDDGDDREWWLSSSDINIATGQSQYFILQYVLKPNSMNQDDIISRRND
ncbi:MAG: LamG domain-containing protein, partial [Nanoarchaeota archaeon]|nr:LamG domain-containing protein [Nanoarchaeota archaeon]